MNATPDEPEYHAAIQRLLELKEKISSTIEQHQRPMEALQNQIKGIEAAMKALGMATD
jgi:prefoldin subunit 5